jgi:hypothetical protein
MSNMISTWEQERIEFELVEQEKKEKKIEDIEFDNVVLEVIDREKISTMACSTHQE